MPGRVINRTDAVLQPWLLETRHQAGQLCRQLFWMPSLPPEAVADAMEEEIGFELVEDRLSLCWILRRIMCDAV